MPPNLLRFRKEIRGAAKPCAHSHDPSVTVHSPPRINNKACRWPGCHSPPFLHPLSASLTSFPPFQPTSCSDCFHHPLFLYMKKSLSPGWCGSVHRAPACKPVLGLIPSLGTCLGCGPGPQLRACERQPIDVSLIH